ncbi:MAG TPA: tRNA (adenosine(37)-N6)-threonylcarbamoyltransferase complex dimerization subunit type 1 TsaB [Candidatus Sulfotelmatobacter sp.]|nr:tRNA (adenosine(37)-N6)-threonylcarbamoyltransferase complex dimerization subunit type 1 TsaB [Candidatus Sulfotelmatobacter sp.]
MLLLAADTSGKQGSIALARAGENPGVQVEIIEVVPLVGGTFSAQLVPQISALLEKHGFRKSDIGGFIVASGPGSFTGLRVGLAAIKALAEVLQKPIATVSLLEAVALASGKQGRVTTALDAGRGEFYVGEYEVEGGIARAVTERLTTKDELLEIAKSAALITPDRRVGEMLETSGTRVQMIPAIDAGAIAEIGRKKVARGETVSPEHLEANYIRRSDAEIFSKSL